MNEEFYKEVLFHLSKTVDIALNAIEAKNAEVERVKDRGDDSKLDKFFEEITRFAGTIGLDSSNLWVCYKDIEEMYKKIKNEEDGES